ncbi:MAG: sigma 54-interacting transcriptional regulator [Desulfobacter sp.]|uniref:sigma 54-interacting transcriptional regulator n=1 Tax=uncultured Desulfobacter sp. TaxID=240139 RepID=UPI0029C71DDB|nr:sigma 54-interacting transcriptional regulator [uncultured Desulfobacter sp.]MCW8799883.1 sigma 54-interacting transcriptional regulator [Desulfobacter sp.]
MPECQELKWSHIAEAAVLRDLDGLGHALLNTCPGGVAVFNTALQVVIANRTARTALELREGEHLESCLACLAAPAWQVLESGTKVSGVTVNAGDAVFSALLSPIKQAGRVVGGTVFFEDITDLENMTRRMESFQELSNELDTIIESSNDGLWICDGDGVVLKVNPASEKLSDVIAEDAIGKNMTEIVAEGIIDHSVTLEVLKKRKKVSILQTTRIGRKLFLTGNPVFDANGRLVRVVVNERDITDISRLHRELEEKALLNAQYKRDLLEKQVYEAESQRIVAKSANYLAVMQKAVKLGGVDSTVLILGESGTGKGMISDLIHRYSTRADHPMIKINCGSIPETLVESELFGYEKGAFTGAGKQGKPGKFEIADKGIIFLDEIADLPAASQVKLLKFLEDGVITRVGSTRNRKVNVRIIAATNRDLKKMVDTGQFRNDLYYRLNVVPINIPPLRERKECIVPLFNHYILEFSRKYGKERPGITGEILDALAVYDFPGNVREMINICERLVVMSHSDEISLKDLPGVVRENIDPRPLITDPWQSGQTFRQMVETFEKELLTQVLQTTRTQSEAAEKLGLNQSTIARKVQKYRIRL